MICGSAAMQRYSLAYAQPRWFTTAPNAAGHARSRSRSVLAALAGPRCRGAVYGRSGCFLVSERIVMINQHWGKHSLSALELRQRKLDHREPRERSGSGRARAQQWPARR